MALKKKITSKCKNCPCKDFKFIPTRPEECGMYWLPRRKEFKVSEWKPKCKCKQPHDAHKPVAPFMGPGCNGFYSDFACIACDCRWEDHSTLFEYEDERRMQGKKVGKEYLPLSMNKELQDLVFHTDRKALPNNNRARPNPNAIKAGPGSHQFALEAEEDDYEDDRYLNPAEHRNYLDEKQHFKAISNQPYRPAQVASKPNYISSQAKPAPKPLAAKPTPTFTPSPSTKPSPQPKQPTATSPAGPSMGMSYGNYNTTTQRKKF